MRDEIANIMQRDLEQLPVLPPERWLPRHVTTRSSARPLFAAVAAVALAAVFVIGVEFGQRLPLDPAESLSAMHLSRQEIIERMRVAPFGVAPDRYMEARLVVSGQFAQARPDLGLPTSNALWWVVAVSGDRPDGSKDLQALTPSMLYALDAADGGLIGRWEAPRAWPAGFDSLTDRTAAANSLTSFATIVDLPEPGVVSVQLPVQSGGVGGTVRLRADRDTGLSWVSGLARGTASSLPELVQREGLGRGSMVEVRFDRTLQPDGTHRLEVLTTGIASK
jgi:hypothetical protein